MIRLFLTPLGPLGTLFSLKCNSVKVKRDNQVRIPCKNMIRAFFLSEFTQVLLLFSLTEDFMRFLPLCLHKQRQKQLYLATFLWVVFTHRLKASIVQS